MRAGSRRPREPNWINEQTLLVLHAQQVERFGGLHGVRDDRVVTSALSRPINHWNYNDDADISELAAVYLVAFAGTQGFNDGNKRTGLACALVFLSINGVEVSEFEPMNLLQLTMEVATGRATYQRVAQYFRQNTVA